MSILVPPSGPKSAKIAIVGEAPGEKEVIRGEPFVGNAGNELDRILTESSIVRSMCYITNVVKERPEQNDISKFIRFTKHGAECTDAYRMYEKLLYEELADVQANIIIALGNPALYTLTRLVPPMITKRRGSLYASPVLNGRKVMAAIHPSAIIQGFQWTWHRFTVHDFIEARHESEFPELRLPQYDLRVRPSFMDMMYFIEQCSKYKEVAFDIEVINEEVSCFALAYADREINTLEDTKYIHSMCFPLHDEHGDYMTVDEERELFAEIALLLQAKPITKLMQNGSFDSTFIFNKYGIRVSPLRDTMFAEAILYPDYPKGLDFLCSTWTKQPYYKDEGKRWRGTGGTFEEFWGYNAKDSAVLLDIHPKQVRTLVQLGNLDSYLNKCRLAHPCMYIQEHGLPMDIAGMKAAAIEEGNKMEALKKEFAQLTNHTDINLDSPQQLMKYFYGEMGIKPYKKKTKSASGTRYVDTLDDLAARKLAKGTSTRAPIKAAAILRDYRRLQKRKSTYLEMQADLDGRMRCSINPVGVKFGRVSSSKNIFGTGGNFQNLPHWFYKYILIDQGMVGYSMDLSQAENRCVAYIAPEPTMINAFESGIDIHTLTASMIFDKPVDQISREEGSSDLGNGDQSERYWGKKGNHGTNYGLGYVRFADLNDLQITDAKMILSKLHTRYPGVHEYHEWVKHQLSSNRTLVDCLGKNAIFLEPWGSDLFTAAYSYIPQSTIATILNDWGLIYIYENQHYYRHICLANQVHDSLWLWMPDTLKPWQHADTLLRIRDNLTQELHWEGRSWRIPADGVMRLGHMGEKEVEGKKLKTEIPLDYGTTTEQLARRLSEIYEEHRTSGVIQHMGWD